MANLLARKQHKYFFGASVTTVCLFFFVIGRVLTRLDNNGNSNCQLDSSHSLTSPFSTLYTLTPFQTPNAEMNE